MPARMRHRCRSDRYCRTSPGRCPRRRASDWRRAAPPPTSAARIGNSRIAALPARSRRAAAPCRPAVSLRASMVRTCPLPMVETGVTQERRASPFTWMVHAPHSATPQPNLVPVSPSSSRSTQSMGVSPSTSTSARAPFTLSWSVICRPPHHRRASTRRAVSGRILASAPQYRRRAIAQTVPMLR